MTPSAAMTNTPIAVAILHGLDTHAVLAIILGQVFGARAKLRLRLQRPPAKASEFIPEVADENLQLSERDAVMTFVVGQQGQSPRRAIAYPVEPQPLSREECAPDV